MFSWPARRGPQHHPGHDGEQPLDREVQEQRPHRRHPEAQQLAQLPAPEAEARAGAGPDPQHQRGRRGDGHLLHHQAPDPRAQGHQADPQDRPAQPADQRAQRQHPEGQLAPLAGDDGGAQRGERETQGREGQHGGGLIVVHQVGERRGQQPAPGQQRQGQQHRRGEGGVEVPLGHRRALHQGVVEQHADQHVQQLDQGQHDREQPELGRAQELGVHHQRGERHQRQAAVLHRAPDGRAGSARSVHVTGSARSVHATGLRRRHGRAPPSAAADPAGAGPPVSRRPG